MRVPFSGNDLQKTRTLKTRLIDRSYGPTPTSSAALWIAWEISCLRPKRRFTTAADRLRIARAWMIGRGIFSVARPILKFSCDLLKKKRLNASDAISPFKVKQASSPLRLRSPICLCGYLNKSKRVALCACMGFSHCAAFSLSGQCTFFLPIDAARNMSSRLYRKMAWWRRVKPGASAHPRIQHCSKNFASTRLDRE